MAVDLIRRRGWQQLLAGERQDGAFDEIFQFANVAGARSIAWRASMASAGMYSTPLLSWRLNQLHEVADEEGEGPRRAREERWI